MESFDSTNDLILHWTGATRIIEQTAIESLWSGYGRIIKVHLAGGSVDSVVVKMVQPPTKSSHPRGWNSDRSHERKLRSYQVESTWYRDWSGLCDGAVRVPKCFAVERIATRDGATATVFVLEDLDAAGFPIRKRGLDLDGVFQGLTYLASFHARFMGKSPGGLWPVGTYWHLQTRPDELAAMGNGPLKERAAEIDQRLRDCPFQTIVHGDAKVANFCFSRDDRPLAAVDFQYVGGGCGMKDVAYFLGSCIDEETCRRHQDAWLDHYFQCLRSELGRHGSPVALDALETCWREMYVLAWADFTRFMLGWCPTHSKLNRYSSEMSARAIELL